MSDSIEQLKSIDSWSMYVNKSTEVSGGEPIFEVEKGLRYRSRSGYLMEVTGFSRHAQDCSVTMVHYINLEPTFDYPSGQPWVMEESLFLRLFTIRDADQT